MSILDNLRFLSEDISEETQFLWKKAKKKIKGILPEYKIREIYKADGELDLEALIKNHEFRKKKEKEQGESVEEFTVESGPSSVGYIHVPYLPITASPTVNRDIIDFYTKYGRNLDSEEAKKFSETLKLRSEIMEKDVF